MANIGLKTLGQDVQEIEHGRYSIAADFPNTTTLYAWHLNTTDPTAAWIGGITLTENGPLASSTDHLGNTSDCLFDGVNDYLNSASGSLNVNGTFSLACWASAVDWADTGTTRALITNYDSAPSLTGWIVRSSGTFGVGFGTYNAGVINTQLNCPSTISFAANSWHHIALTRTSGGNTQLYIDGKWAVSVVSPTISAPSNDFRIGEINGGGWPWNGKIDEVIVHDGTAWSEDQVRKIYEMGARRFGAIDQNSKVQIPQNETIYYPQRPLTVTGTNWVTHLAVGLPYQDILGTWRLKFNFAGYLSSGSSTQLDVAITGVTFKSGAAGEWKQACACCGPTAAYYYAMTMPATSTVRMICGVAAVTFRVSGDVELDSKPNI